MHRDHPTSVSQYLAGTYDDDRARGVDRRNAQHRALLEAGVIRPGLWTRLRAAVQRPIRIDHSLADRPCRLPDGGVGRIAIVLLEGEPTAVCRLAG